MAKKKQPITVAQFHCSDCAHHYNECSPAQDGHMILCYCKHFKDGKWAQFLNSPACDRFKPAHNSAHNSAH